MSELQDREAEIALGYLDWEAKNTKANELLESLADTADREEVRQVFVSAFSAGGSLGNVMAFDAARSLVDEAMARATKRLEETYVNTVNRQGPDGDGSGARGTPGGVPG